MSYLSGLAIGLSAGKQIHHMFRGQSCANLTPNFSQKINMHTPPQKTTALILIHTLPGRRRYQSTRLIGNLKLATELKCKIQALPSITSVEINPYTGSMLLNYSCNDAQIDGLVDYLQDKFLGSSKSPSHSEVGLQIRNIFINLDQFIRQFTNNQFDLRSLIASIFITRGINKVLTFKQYPSGPQMLWWAFTLLRGWVIK
ncbi:MAG: hypothetical protein H6Q70_4066 [Firmicutes bacterium]|nr:hypothetical protein [Bacillota bacterium]